MPAVPAGSSVDATWLQGGLCTAAAEPLFPAQPYGVGLARSCEEERLSPCWLAVSLVCCVAGLPLVRVSLCACSGEESSVCLCEPRLYKEHFVGIFAGCCGEKGSRVCGHEQAPARGV